MKAEVKIEIEVKVRIEEKAKANTHEVRSLKAEGPNF